MARDNNGLYSTHAVDLLQADRGSKLKEQTAMTEGIYPNESSQGPIHSEGFQDVSSPSVRRK